MANGIQTSGSINSGGTTNTQISTTLTVTAGDSILVMLTGYVTGRTPAAGDVTDSASNSYVIDKLSSSYSSTACVWRATASTSGSITIYYYNGGSNFNIYGKVVDVRGFTATPVDQALAVQSAYTDRSISTGNTATLAQASEFVVALVSDGMSSTGMSTPASSGYTSLANISSIDISYKTVASTTAVSASWTYGADAYVVCALVTYKFVTNTAPTITAGPTTTYAVGSDTRPSNTWGVTFTPSDAEQTGANALNWQIRTSSTWGSGTQVASGTCTSGSSKVVTGLAYNASGLVNGSQTLYLHIDDGTDHTATAGSFTLLVIMAPVVPATVAGVSSLSATLSTPAAVVPATIAGVSSLTASPLSAPTKLSLATIAAQSSLSATVGAPNPYVLPDAIVMISSASALLSSPTMLSVAGIAGQSGVSGTLSTPGYLAPSPIAGQGSAAAILSTPAFLALAAIATQSGLSGILSAPALLTLAQIAAQSSLTATLTVLLPPGELGLRVDVYDSSGTKLGFGPITSALGGSYRLALDQVGSFTLDIPAEEERASYVTVGCQLWFYWASEGLVFRGMVDRKQSIVDADGKTVLRITGSSLARQLVNLNTLLGMAFNGSTLSAAVGSNASANTLLYQTGWAAGALDVPGTTLLARFDGLSRWEALAKAAQQFKLHVREDHITLSGGNPVRNVDVGAFGASSGIVFKNVDSVSPNLRQNTALYPIAGLTVLEDGNDLWNSIIPVGAGEGINQLTLKYSDRSVAGGFAYNISSATGPDGQAYYYLEDSTSVTAYGRRQRVVSIKDAAPLALSAAGMKAASNALYDQAVTYLIRYKDPPSTYEVEVVGLKHVSQGAPLFKPGDKVRLLYHGVAHDRSGDRAWLTVDANVFLTEFTRTFAENGADAWKLTVSTVDRLAEDDAAKIGQAFQNVFALSVAMKPYTFTTKAGPQRGSLDSGTSKALTLTVTFDANVGMLHKAKLRWQATALRSNVSVAAAGGAQTSSSGGGATTSAGGAQTSSSQSDHTHSVSGQSTSSNSGHRHRMFQYQSSDSLNTDVPSNNTSDAFTGNSAYESAAGDPHYHGLSNHTHQMAQHTHNIPDFRLMYGKASDGTTNVWVRISEYATYQDIYTFDSDTSHTHNISTATSAAGGSHSHTVSDHTHTVSAHTHTVSSHTHTVADHTHGLTYGVVDDTTPTNPQLSIAINGVDRTAAITTQLGSAAWRDAMNSWQTVDVSAWLSDTNGIVLQQVNTVTFTVGKAATHLDIEAQVRALVTATSLVPV